jgi:hypothetical protein
MDFREASNAHRDWKIRLRSYIAGVGEALDEADVARSDVCALGRWLHGIPEAERDAVTMDLIAVHERFHACAAEVVATAQRGSRTEALAMLDPGTAFADASFRVVALIARVAGR